MRGGVAILRYIASAASRPERGTRAFEVEADYGTIERLSPAGVLSDFVCMDRFTRDVREWLSTAPETVVTRVDGVTITLHYSTDTPTDRRPLQLLVSAPGDAMLARCPWGMVFEALSGESFKATATEWLALDVCPCERCRAFYGAPYRGVCMCDAGTPTSG